MTFSALDSALTGPLFATDAMRAAWSDTARLGAMLRAEAALARAQARLGLAPADLAPAIEAIRPETLDADAIGRTTALAGVPAIPFVKAVQARLPPALEAAFHKGSTTQDILDTATSLQARDALDLLAADLAATVAALEDLATRHRETPCVGRTYGQHAAPVTFGFKVAVWLVGIADAAAALPRHRDALAASFFGPVGTFAAFGADGPAVSDAVAAELGLAASPIAWHARRGRVAELGAFLAILMGALAKMATDVAALVSTEIGEAAEPYVKGRGGSTAMPHKRNPVSCTVILAAASAAKGSATTLIDAMAGAHERPAGLWHAEWHALPTLFGLASGALRETRALAEGLEVHPARMRENIDATRGLLFADAAATRLAPLVGGHAAHEAVGRATDAVRVSGRHLREVLGDDPALAVEGRDEALDAAFALDRAVAAAAAWTDRALAAP